jgi:hypothetical protein
MWESLEPSTKDPGHVRIDASLEKEPGRHHGQHNQPFSLIFLDWNVFGGGWFSCNTD